MRILAIETTDKTGGVAAIDGCNLLEELTLEQSQRSAQSLAPAMQALLKHVGWRSTDVQCVGIAVGPGSFTGLRVGVTAAKVFAYAVGADVIGVNTLEVIAANCPLSFHKITAVMDAQRGEVVSQQFALAADGDFWEAAGPQRLIDADAWLAELAPGDVVAGPILARLLDRLPQGVVALDERDWHPRAAMVGRLTARYHALGQRDDLWKLVPFYSRRSAAEEKAEEKLGEKMA
jgi:tRNA threonylcarbamoyladenosine biosynthesis protein TsaB